MKKLILTGLVSFTMLFQACDYRANTFSFIAMPTHKKIRLKDPVADSMKLCHILSGGDAVLATGIVRQQTNEGSGYNAYAWAGINFINTHGRQLDPGTILLNGKEYYFPTLFGTTGMGVSHASLNNANTWHISGGSFGAGASFDIPGPFPEYKKDLPQSVSKDKDLKFAFTETTIPSQPATTKDADRAFVMLWSGNTYHVSPVTNARSGDIKIDKEVLTNLYNDSHEGRVNINIVLYRLTNRGLNGKTIHFPVISEKVGQMIVQ